MVVLFNYLPFLVVAVAIILAVTTLSGINKHGTEKTVKRLIGIALTTVILQLVLAVMTNSVIPKGTVERLPNPEFEGSETPITDKLRKPERTTEESRKHLEEISDWRAAKKRREEEAQR